MLFRIDPILTESLKKLVEALPESVCQLSPGVQAFGFIKGPTKLAPKSWSGHDCTKSLICEGAVEFLPILRGGNLLFHQIGPISAPIPTFDLPRDTNVL